MLWGEAQAERPSESSSSGSIFTPKKQARRSALPTQVELYFHLLEAGIHMSQRQPHEAAAVLKRSKECMMTSVGSHLWLAGHHLEGLLAYERGNYDIVRSPPPRPAEDTTRNRARSVPRFVLASAWHRAMTLAVGVGGPQAAEYFSTVQEVGATMTGPLVDAVMVAAGCNCALAEERAGHKMQALRTMRRLNARVQR